MEGQDGVKKRRQHGPLPALPAVPAEAGTVPLDCGHLAAGRPVWRSASGGTACDVCAEARRADLDRLLETEADGWDGQDDGREGDHDVV